MFSLGSRCLPASRTISKVRYSGLWGLFLLFLPLRGCHPLRRRIPADFGSEEAEVPHACNPTSPLSFPKGFGLGSAAFGRPYSRHPCWFLFLRVLRCFSSPRSPSGGKTSGLIRQSRGRRLRAPHPGLSQLATAFVGSQPQASTLRVRSATWRTSYALQHSLIVSAVPPSILEGVHHDRLNGPGGIRTPDLPHAKRTRYHCATGP